MALFLVTTIHKIVGPIQSCRKKYHFSDTKKISILAATDPLEKSRQSHATPSLLAIAAATITITATAAVATLTATAAVAAASAAAAFHRRRLPPPPRYRVHTDNGPTTARSICHLPCHVHDIASAHP